MSKILNSLRICIRSVAYILLAGLLISGGAVKPALAQSCDKGGGALSGAVLGGATGSMFGRNKGKKGATIGGALIGGAMGAKRDRKAKARCIQEREISKDRDAQRQLDYDRQRLLQEEQVRQEIEEKRLFDEWQRERQAS